jgi:hypothetical protein
VVRVILIALPRFRERAVCSGLPPSWFFPRKDESAQPAKDICNGTDGRPPCPARQECLAWALTHEEAGVWGGLSEDEREALRGSV